MWEWAHTQGAYENVRENIFDLDRESLEIIFSEWEATKGRDDSFNPALYEKALKKAKKLPSDILADYIYEHATEQADCDNGGHDAYICPYGCHSVSFDRDNNQGKEGD